MWPNQCHIPRPYPVSLLETEEDMTKWAFVRLFDKFERDWKYNAFILVSTIPDLADGAAPRTP
jgi:hypothetical protein